MSSSSHHRETSDASSHVAYMDALSIKSGTPLVDGSGSRRNSAMSDSTINPHTSLTHAIALDFSSLPLEGSEAGAAAPSPEKATSTATDSRPASRASKISVRSRDEQSPYRLAKVPGSNTSMLRVDNDNEDGDETKVNSAEGSMSEVKVEYPPVLDTNSDRKEYGAGVGNDVIPNADKGLRAWLNVLGAFLALFASFGYTNAFGCYQSYYKLSIYSTHDASDISWIGSVQLSLFFFSGVIVGPLFDRGHFRLLLRFGSAIYITSIFLIPQCTKFWQTILVQGVMSGIGIGCIFLPSMSLLSHFFVKRRSLVMGIAVSGSSVGGICFPIMLNHLFKNPNVGFTNGVRASGYVISACLVISNIIMSPNPHFKARPKPTPPNIRVIFDKQYTLTVLGAFLTVFGLFFPNFYLQVFCQYQGLSENLSFYSLSIFNAASVFGRTIPNALADKIGPFNILATCCSIAGFLLFAMFGATSPGGAIAFAILYGFFSGAYVSLLSPVCISLSRSVDEVGVRQGLAFIFIGTAALGGNPTAGALLARFGTFTSPIVFSGTMVLAGSTAIIVARTWQTKVKDSWKV